MSMPISSIAPAPVPATIDAISARQGSSGIFESVLSEAVGKLDQLHQEANASVARFLSGEGEEIHHVALAIHKSETAFEMFTQVRNKVISAYQEVMRMQL